MRIPTRFWYQSVSHVRSGSSKGAPGTGGDAPAVGIKRALGGTHVHGAERNPRATYITHSLLPSCLRARAPAAPGSIRRSRGGRALYRTCRAPSTVCLAS